MPKNETPCEKNIFVLTGLHTPLTINSDAGSKNRNSNFYYYKKKFPY